ncbi:A-type potassium channel modulatory protein KCNIP1 [Dermatophagoides farinae]|uniref:Ca2+ sensor calsenilin-like protein n=1 Tax=Dermatophagoides farinae TaxID=6954 RepID=A0A922HY42_DERFA|nr:Kv channel-interacting protein 1-like [Dermatophagoides farinae]KAH7646258.1 ca2+ sensor calsenilin-like protein [Dermatophagoides farinae]KAH9516681.1 Calsenilin, variant 2 [Dermatophagoides farinae]
MNTSTFALSSSSTSPRRPISSYHRSILQQQQFRRKCRNKFPSNSQDGDQSSKMMSSQDHGKADQPSAKLRRSSSTYSSASANNTNIGQHVDRRYQQIKFKTNPFQYLSFRFIDLLHKAFEKEEKVDELEQMINEICGGQEFIYRRQQEIDVLCQKTSFSKKEIKLLYWGWKLACPEGVLNEPIFKDIYSQFFPQAGDSSIYARYVFQAMFADELSRNEPITFLEYAKALSNLCRGTLTDKIKWIFTLYDINHDGRITYDEVYKMSVAIYALLGFHVTPAHNYKTYEEHARRMFAKLDQNSIGYVTFDEFKDICLKNETILTSMQQLDTHSI